MSLAFSQPDSILSTTLANYSKTLQENIFRSNVLLFFLSGKTPETPGQDATGRSKLVLLSGGESIVRPLLYEKNSTAKSYTKYGTIDTSPQEGISAARFAWKQSAATITISGLEERQNNGDSQIINLLEGKIMQAEMSLSEELDRQLNGTGTDSSTDMTGLQTLVSTTGTVGGIARSTNTWWQSNVTASVGSFAANGLDNMRTMFNNASKGSDTPDFLMTTQSIFEYYEKVLQPQERYTNTMMGDAGFTNLKFKDKPIAYDPLCASGTMYFLNSKYIQLVMHSDANFKTTDFVTPTDQDAKTAKILVQGELTATNCKRLGALTGITA